MALRDCPGWLIGSCWFVGFLLLGFTVRWVVADGTGGKADIPGWLPLLALLLSAGLLLLTRRWRQTRGGPS
ncbi:MAG TPA: hypothetical protein VMM18_03930 [Gemmatimonadaceae bacterium]|nr:hypothetical protein [Gemmatimonadaceae bacterium]